MITTFAWVCLAAVTAAALFWGINDKNNNLKSNGMNDNFVTND